MVGQMNHIGVLVNNLEETEEKVKSAGFTPVSHADYEPGRRFYFYDDAGVEFEVISYSGGRLAPYNSKKLYARGRHPPL